MAVLTWRETQSILLTPTGSTTLVAPPGLCEGFVICARHPYEETWALQLEYAYRPGTHLVECVLTWDELHEPEPLWAVHALSVAHYRDPWHALVEIAAWFDYYAKSLSEGEP